METTGLGGAAYAAGLTVGFRKAVLQLVRRQALGTQLDQAEQDRQMRLRRKAMP